MASSNRVGSSCVVVLACAAALGCNKDNRDRSGVQTPELRSGEVAAPPSRAQEQPPITDKDPMAVADADMKKVLEQLSAMNPKPLPSLGAAEARKQPSPADALKAVLQGKDKKVTPEEVAKTEMRKIPSGAKGQQIDVRLYTPKTDDKRPLPVIVYFHGGGWVIATIDTYDASARALANESHAILAAVEYRKAPENKFPAAHDDALAAYDWVLKNAASFGGDPQRVAVAGESAGGNLAAAVSMMARDKGMPLPVHQVLVYPIATTHMDTASYREWAKAKPLDKPAMEWFFSQYERSPADAADPRLDLANANLRGLPPTTVINAEIDPLRSDGDLLVKKLQADGVDVRHKLYEGVTHEFFGMGAYVSDARDAVDYAADMLRGAFKK